MGVKYRNTFTNTNGATVKTDILITGYGGAIIPINTVNESPVIVERQASDNGKLYGVFGSALKITLFNEGNVTVTDFLVNAFSECQVNLYINEVLEFTGFIVLDDITTELRANPIQLQLTFADNLSLLSDKRPSFTIDNNFTLLITVVRELLSLTGLTLPLNVFHRPYPDTESYEIGSFESVKILERTFAQSLQEFEPAKNILEKLCNALRCRIYQSKGEWYMVRVHDYLYGATLQGWAYDGSDTGIAITYDATPIDSLVMLQFSQQVTYKRAVSEVTNKYNFDAGFQLFNADLQELGSFVSDTIVDDTTVKRYNIPSYWVVDGAFTPYIVIVQNTISGQELNRYIEIPAISASDTGDVGLRFNPILCSVNDRFGFSLDYAATTNSNFAARFVRGYHFKGVSGQNYIFDFPTTLFGVKRIVWTPVAYEPEDMVTSLFNEQPGSFDNRGIVNYSLTSDDINAGVFVDGFPEDGYLYIKLGAFKNNSGRLADLVANINSIEFRYVFLVNTILGIEAQQHKTLTSAQSLNIFNEEIYIDQSTKFSAIGNIYDLDNNKVAGWLWPDGGGYSIAIGELNNSEEGEITGEGRRVIGGIFLGAFDMPDLWSYDGSSWLPVRLVTDYRYGRIDAEFLELVSQLGGSYAFSYIYKSKE